MVYTISWTQNGVDMDGFKVYETTTSPPVVRANVGKGVNGATISTTLVVNGALDHQYYVAAYNAAGDGPRSATVSFQAQQPPSQAPTNVVIV